MKLAGKPGYGRERVGVLDAGVVVTRLDPTRRGHADAIRLFEVARTATLQLVISTVNLAEALEHSRKYTLASGVDLVVALQAFRVDFELPDVGIARRVAALAAIEDVSLADRFALAAAQERRARLFTTDAVLARAALRLKLPTTRL